MKPVIIIPGLMGSVIKTVSDQTTLWPAATYSTLRRLALNPDGSDVEENRAIATDIIMSAAGTGIYRRIFSYYGRRGYEEGTTLFGCHYDWRKDLQKASTFRLAPIVEQAKHASGEDQVNLIAHSMGGLVAARYMTESDTNLANIAECVMLGSPLVGAPKAYLSIRLGEESPIPWFVPFSPSQTEFRQIVSNLPGPYQLLPSARFEAFNGGGFVYVNGRRLSIEETYQSQADAEFNVEMALAGLTFHSTIDKKITSLRRRTHLIMGTGLDTVKTIQFDGTTVTKGTNENGDATVLNLGLRDYLEPRRTIIVDEVEHLDLVRDDDVLDMAFRIVTQGHL